MEIKYAIRPGYVRSMSDGDMHYISAGMLINLYQVSRAECLIVKKDMRISESEERRLINLFPRADGNYSI